MSGLRRGRRRLLVAAAVTLAASLTAAGCSSKSTPAAESAPTTTIAFDFSGDAAVVAGKQIPAQTVADQLATYKTVPEALSIATGHDQLFQTGTDQYDPVVVADVLQTEIAVKLIRDELTNRNITITPEQRVAAAQRIQISFSDVLDKLPVGFLQETADRFAGYIALDQALIDPISDEQLRAAYNADPTKYVLACVRHILVAEEAAANQVVADLRAGGDFAALAKERSQDPGSAGDGGDLGCTARGAFVDAFDKAAWEGPVGQIQGPLKTEFGYHVIQVTKRGQLSFDEAKEEVRVAETPEAFSSLQAWLQVRFLKAPITVDPRFGTWDATTGQVVPKGAATSGLQVQPAGK